MGSMWTPCSVQNRQNSLMLWGQNHHVMSRTYRWSPHLHTFEVTQDNLEKDIDVLFFHIIFWSFVQLKPSVMLFLYIGGSRLYGRYFPKQSRWINSKTRRGILHIVILGWTVPVRPTQSTWTCWEMHPCRDTHTHTHTHTHTLCLLSDVWLLS